MQASAVPVRPRPPPHATSTRSVPARFHASARVVRAASRSLGRRKSGQRTHADSQGTSGGVLPSRYTPRVGTGPAGSGRRSPRPRTRRPEGSRSTPGTFASHASVIEHSLVAHATGERPQSATDVVTTDLASDHCLTTWMSATNLTAAPPAAQPAVGAHVLVQPSVSVGGGQAFRLPPPQQGRHNRVQLHHRFQPPRAGVRDVDTDGRQHPPDLSAVCAGRWRRRPARVHARRRHDVPADHVPRPGHAGADPTASPAAARRRAAAPGGRQRPVPRTAARRPV